MELLDIETVLEKTKVTAQVEAVAVQGSKFGVQSSEGKSNKTLKGYEIHMGRTTGDVGLFKLRRTSSDSELGTLNVEPVSDGSAKGNVWGTYIHGIFDNDLFRRGLINSLRTKERINGDR